MQHEALNTIEIKHVSESITNMKTRGQFGHVVVDGEEFITILARAGNKILGSKSEQVVQLEEWLATEDIPHNKIQNLVSLKDIFNPKSDIADLVMRTSHVTVNVDYDYKRRLNIDGTTVPFQTMDEMLKYRGSADYLRNAKKKRATPEDVAYAAHLSKQNVRRGNSPVKFAVNHFLRAMVQKVAPFIGFECEYGLIAELLKGYGVTVSQIANAKRFPFKANVITNTSSNRKLIRGMLKALSYATTRESCDTFYSILLFKGIRHDNA